jgi:peptidyl-dipeptidase A
VGAGEAVVSFVACLRALEAAGKVWRPGSRQRPHPRGSARQHVGPGMGEHLSPGCPEGRRPRLRFDCDSERTRNAAGGHGEVWRALLHVSRIRAAAEDVLGAVFVREAARSRCGLSRQRLGHRFCYQRAYDQQPFLFRDSANDGFHEAIGDTIALSITPEYLKKIGLLAPVPDSSKDLGLLLYKALEKVAFLPFGLLIDKWRWQVFSGQISPEQYNESWWKLRLQYQGIAPPVPRSEADFDPGAKYHVPANTPYARYFLAYILQFQFHRALAKVAGCTGPLNRCSIYDSKAAGDRLNAMLSMGASQPWPKALAALTGQDQMDATAILDYFAPLKKWLDEQNRGKPVGW